ncbi:hypothetical protein QJS66_12915 [Kocuria rhizophila]|nr:hypothetical protein QJS66_12915 [Kocuria rhizophila]
MTGSDQHTPGTKGIPARSAEEDVDVVIGGGPRGAWRSTRTEGGLSTVIVEESLMGGDSSYYACMPSKALLRPVEVARRRAPGRRDSPGRPGAGAARAPGRVGSPTTTTPGRFTRRSRSARGAWARGRSRAAHRAGRRTGRSADRSPRGGRRHRLHRGGPASPGELHAWSSKDATGVVEVPPRLAVVGGGVGGRGGRHLAGRARLLRHATTCAATRCLAKNRPFVGDSSARAWRTPVSVRLSTTVQTAHREVRDTRSQPVHGGPVQLRQGGPLEVDECSSATGRRRASPTWAESGGDRPEDARAASCDWLRA